MIVTMTARYSALHYDDAVVQGTSIWRVFIGDPHAELPWDANSRVELGAKDTVNATGAVVSSHIPSGEAVLTVKISKTQSD